MLIYQRIILASVTLLLLAGVADYFMTFSAWIYIGIILVTLGLLAYGSASIRSGFYCRAFCSAGTEKRLISLTFDDGPDPEVTPLILDILMNYNIKALFFCIGVKAKANPEIIERIHNEGHIIGSHSLTHHFLFDFFSRGRIFNELRESEKILADINGRKVKLFRPPFGVTNPALAWAVKKMGYNVIGWSVKSRDTVISDGNRLFRRLARHLGEGRIFLFHDTMRVTAEVLENFIKFVEKENFGIERADRLLKIKAYE